MNKCFVAVVSIALLVKSLPASFVLRPLHDLVREADLVTEGEIVHQEKKVAREGEIEVTTDIKVFKVLKGDRLELVKWRFWPQSSKAIVKEPPQGKLIWLLTWYPEQGVYIVRHPQCLQPKTSEARILKIIQEQSKWPIIDLDILVRIRIICEHLPGGVYHPGDVPLLELTITPGDRTPKLDPKYEARVEVFVRRPNGSTLRHIVAVGQDVPDFQKVKDYSTSIVVPHPLEIGVSRIYVAYIVQPKGVWSCDLITKSNTEKIEVLLPHSK